MRNIVTSGLSLGTVVVEAGPTSGARQQADHATARQTSVPFAATCLSSSLGSGDGRPSGVLAIDDIDQIVADIEAEVMESDDVLI